MTQQELKELLAYHDDLYYNQDAPEISDAEYDKLKNEYVKLYGEYNYVPGEASKNSVRYTHTSPILSLDKVQITDEDKLRAELERLFPVIIQPKMDGLTVVYYPDTDTYVTRGNGHIGEDITPNMQRVLGTGHKTTHPVRMEVVMLKSQFNRLNKIREEEGLELFKNPRNAAAGMLRQKDSSKVQGLAAYAYNILEDNTSARQQVETLSQTYLWNTVNSYTPTSIDDAIRYLKQCQETRNDLDYEIDGMVIKHDGIKDFGMTGHHPKNAIAVKFETEGKWTTLKRIVWQVGRTGKITPVAEFEPIDLLGSEVSRATLHNYGMMKAINLDKLHYNYETKEILTRVFVVKANDIIPAIIEVNHFPSPSIKNLIEPYRCPECEEATEKINDQLFCTNPNCSAKVLGRLVHMANREAFDIEGLSEETSKKLIDKYKEVIERDIAQLMNSEEVMTMEDSEYYQQEAIALDNKQRKINNLHPSFIYDLTYEDILELEGFAKVSAKKLYDAIQDSKIIDLDRFLYGCGIPLIGKRVAKDIAQYYSTKDNAIKAFTDDFYNDFEDLNKINGIGSETINSLKKNWFTHIVPFGYVSGFIIKPIKTNKKAENQLSIVVTGKFEISRNEIKEMIEKAGHKFAGSVSKKTSYLLASPGEEGTSKYKNATINNIPIIKSIKELKEIL